MITIVNFDITRLDMEPGAIVARVWKELVSRVRSYLAAQGIADIILEYASERPAPHPVSGKFRRVWTERQDGLQGDQQHTRVPSPTRRE